MNKIKIHFALFLAVLTAVLVLFVAFVGVGGCVAYADDGKKAKTQNGAEYAYKQLVSEDDLHLLISRVGNNRTAFTSGEKQASNYLVEIMQGLGLSYYNGKTNYIAEFKVRGKTSQNIIGVKRADSENAKTIILGAHYDNAYEVNGTQTKSSGVFDNCSGLLCLIAVMRELNALNLNHNIIYVFYGAEECGLNGSKSFVSSINAIQKKDVLFAINFDSIGVGEQTYYYSGDSDNAYGAIFANEYGVNPMPAIKRLNLLANFEGFAYTHIGLMSDNATYLKNGIKCTTFFSGNLTHAGSGYIESVKGENIAHTQNDNSQYILQTYPNFITNINNVANVATMVLSSNDLTQTVQQYNGGINLFFLNNKIVIGAIFLAGIIILVMLKPNLSRTSTKQ